MQVLNWKGLSKNLELLEVYQQAPTAYQADSILQTHKSKEKKTA